MASKPLEAEYREQLSQLLASRKGMATAQAWGIHRSTLAEAAIGMPKAESTRFLIKSKLNEKKPI